MADGSTVTTAPPAFFSVNVTGNDTSAASVQVAKVVKWLTLSLGLPAIGLALYALKNLSKGLSSLTNMFVCFSIGIHFKDY